MRDLDTICTHVKELTNPVAWDAAVAVNNVSYPICDSDFDFLERMGQAVYCYEGIQATLCPLGLVDLDPDNYPPGSLAYVADGYVYVVESITELQAMQE